jgi:hypothetical protein
LRRKLPNVELLPGSTGRNEFYCKGVPLGPLMIAPFVGDWLAGQLAPFGTVVTNRGGFGTLNCHAYVDWRVDSQANQGVMGQGPGRSAAMALIPALIVVVVAVAGLAAAVGWAVSKVGALINAIVEGIDNVFGDAFIPLLIGAGLLVGLALLRRR